MHLLAYIDVDDSYRRQIGAQPNMGREEDWNRNLLRGYERRLLASLAQKCTGLWCLVSESPTGPGRRHLHAVGRT